jgi:pyruvate dehydrogenase E2 component (dihydrolipoamide acetyltransferase)
MYGIELVLPIINPPECGILGVGAIEKRIVPFENNSFGVRELMKLSLACDHRVIDGVYAAGFLNEVKSNLEHFIL